MSSVNLLLALSAAHCTCHTLYLIRCRTRFSWSVFWCRWIMLRLKCEEVKHTFLTTFHSPEPAIACGAPTVWQHFSVRHTLWRTRTCSCSLLNIIIIIMVYLSYLGPLHCSTWALLALMEAASSRQVLLYMSFHQESPLLHLVAADHTRGSGCHWRACKPVNDHDPLQQDPCSTP